MLGVIWGNRSFNRIFLKNKISTFVICNFLTPWQRAKSDLGLNRENTLGRRRILRCIFFTVWPGSSPFLWGVKDEKLYAFYENYPTLKTHSSTSRWARVIFYDGFSTQGQPLCDFGPKRSYNFFFSLLPIKDVLWKFWDQRYFTYF